MWPGLWAQAYDASAGYIDTLAEVFPSKGRFGETMGRDVLEVACGTWTEVIATAAQSVLAADIDPGMSARSRLSSSELGVLSRGGSDPARSARGVNFTGTLATP